MKYKKALITGIHGALAQETAQKILDRYPNIQLIGIDPRLERKQTRGRFKKFPMRYSRSNFEHLFFEHRFDLVLQIGRLPYTDNQSPSTHLHMGLAPLGITKLLELALEFGTSKVIVLAGHQGYGALPDNPVFMNELSPLRGDLLYPELRGTIEMDQATSSFIWRGGDKLEVVLLRACNVIGPQIKNAISTYLSSPVIPYPIDYNPFFQFIHQDDMSDIIVNGITKLPAGVFNVATDDYISLKDLVNKLDAKLAPMPMFLTSIMAHAMKKIFENVPDYFIDNLRYSTLISNDEIKKHLGKRFWKKNLNQIITTLKH